MDFSTLLSTTTAMGISTVDGLFNGVFNFLKDSLPYIIGLIVLSVLLSIGWRMFRYARKSFQPMGSSVFGGLVGTSTALGIGFVNTAFNAIFSVIQNLLPYIVGLVVLAIIMSVGWRLFRYMRSQSSMPPIYGGGGPFSSTTLDQLNGAVSTSTNLGVAGFVNTVFNAIFSVIQNLLPYIVGLVVLAIIMSVGWRLFRYMRS